MGSREIGRLRYRESYAFIGVVGQKVMVEKRGNQNKEVTLSKVFKVRRAKKTVRRVTRRGGGKASGDQEGDAFLSIDKDSAGGIIIEANKDGGITAKVYVKAAMIYRASLLVAAAAVGLLAY